MTKQQLKDLILRISFQLWSVTSLLGKIEERILVTVNEVGDEIQARVPKNLQGFSLLLPCLN